MFQSGFKALDSTATASLWVFSDILLATDAGDSVILIMPDLTAGFDTVETTLSSSPALSNVSVLMVLL